MHVSSFVLFRVSKDTYIGSTSWKQPPMWLVFWFILWFYQGLPLTQLPGSAQRVKRYTYDSNLANMQIFPTCVVENQERVSQLFWCVTGFQLLLSEYECRGQKFLCLNLHTFAVICFSSFLTVMSVTEGDSKPCGVLLTNNTVVQLSDQT